MLNRSKGHALTAESKHKLCQGLALTSEIKDSHTLMRAEVRWLVTLRPLKTWSCGFSLAFFFLGVGYVREAFARTEVLVLISCVVALGFVHDASISGV